MRVASGVLRSCRRRAKVATRAFLAAAIAVVLLVTSARSARADGATSAPVASGPLYWDSAWSHAGTFDYSLTALGALSAVAYLTALQSKQPPLRWTSPVLFDSDVRNLLRGSTPGARNAANTASWGLLGLVLAYPVIDVGYAWKRFGSQVAWDLFWEDATALSLATSFDLSLRDIVGRARPPVSACLTSGGSASQCLGASTEPTRSFPGGHQLIVTTAAALTCTQHLKMNLYGGPWDAVACAVAATTAAAVGLFRIMGDDHWTSDILVGDVIGVAFGAGIPLLMHLHGHAPAGEVLGVRVAPIAVPVRGGGGLGMTGMF